MYLNRGMIKIIFFICLCASLLFAQFRADSIRVDYKLYLGDTEVTAIIGDSISSVIDTTHLKNNNMPLNRMCHLKQYSSTNTGGGGWWMVIESNSSTNPNIVTYLDHPNPAYVWARVEWHVRKNIQLESWMGNNEVQKVFDLSKNNWNMDISAKAETLSTNSDFYIYEGDNISIDLSGMTWNLNNHSIKITSQDSLRFSLGTAAQFVDSNILPSMFKDDIHADSFRIEINDSMDFKPIYYGDLIMFADSLNSSGTRYSVLNFFSHFGVSSGNQYMYFTNRCVFNVDVDSIWQHNIYKINFGERITLKNINIIDGDIRAYGFKNMFVDKSSFTNSLFNSASAVTGGLQLHFAKNIFVTSVSGENWMENGQGYLINPKYFDFCHVDKARGENVRHVMTTGTAIDGYNRVLLVTNSSAYYNGEYVGSYNPFDSHAGTIYIIYNHCYVENAESAFYHRSRNLYITNCEIRDCSRGVWIENQSEPDNQREFYIIDGFVGENTPVLINTDQNQDDYVDKIVLKNIEWNSQDIPSNNFILYRNIDADTSIFQNINAHFKYGDYAVFFDGTAQEFSGDSYGTIRSEYILLDNVNLWNCFALFEQPRSIKRIDIKNSKIINFQSSFEIDYDKYAQLNLEFYIYNTSFINGRAITETNNDSVSFKRMYFKGCTFQNIGRFIRAGTELGKYRIDKIDVVNCTIDNSFYREPYVFEMDKIYFTNLNIIGNSILPPDTTELRIILNGLHNNYKYSDINTDQGFLYTSGTEIISKIDVDGNTINRWGDNYFVLVDSVNINIKNNKMLTEDLIDFAVIKLTDSEYIIANNTIEHGGINGLNAIDIKGNLSSGDIYGNWMRLKGPSANRDWLYAEGSLYLGWNFAMGYDSLFHDNTTSLNYASMNLGNYKITVLNDSLVVMNIDTLKIGE